MQKSNLSELLVEEVRRRVVEGGLPADTRINEVHLAAELEVSRTPLREALNQLVADGLLRVAPRRGYFAFKGEKIDASARLAQRIGRLSSKTTYRAFSPRRV